MRDVLFNNTITLIGLILALWILWRKYEIRALIHPFTIYLVTWVPSCLAIFTYAAIDESFYFFDPHSVVELLSFVQFNVLFVILSLYIIPVKAKNKLLNIKIPFPSNLFKIISYFVFFVLLINIVSSFTMDFTSNRELSTQNAIEINTTGKSSLIYSIVSIVGSLVNPLIIISGGIIIRKLICKKNKIPKYYYLPLLITLITVIVGGGRARIVSITAMLITSTLLFYNYEIPVKQILKKIAFFFLIFIFIFGSYSTFVAASRADKFGYITNIAIQNKKLGFLNGIYEYSFFHIHGYQYRKNDVFTSEPEIWGSSLSFITNLTFPFASQFGMNNNLGSLLGIEKNASNVTVVDAESITATVYFNLHDDFGYVGSIIAILIFTLFTQYLFKWIVTKRIRHVISLALFFFVFSLWSSSWFHHVLGGINLLSLFVPYLLLESLLYAYKKSTHSNPI